VKGVEVYQRKAILYGCGDFLNDYEGISGYEAFRGDLALMYFPTLAADTGDIVRLIMTPMRTQRFRVNRATRDDVAWLVRTMDRECGKLGTRVVPQPDGALALRWDAQPD
jgi:poly-gamma-glutamate synthesis protein (capsule biosynthesis protein)